MFCKITSLVFPWFLVVNVCPELCKAFGLSMDPLLEGAALKLASFNVQVFGAKKMENKLVENALTKTILRYDIILIQEIRSVSNESITALLEGVNRYSHSAVYKMALSARLGRTNSKEQYAFFYRSDKLTLIDSYEYDDGDENTKMDQFQREPFIVRFNSPSSYVSDFAMIAIHTSPSEAVSEIDRLVDVYDDVLRHWNLRDVIILGDFNSGCSYVTRSDWVQIRLATDKRFYWLFSDDVDTTVTKSDCPYDRMVVAGRNMARGIFADSAKVFRFDIAFNLTQEEAEKVSDHWPIEVQLKDTTFRDEEKYFEESVTFTSEDKRMAQLPKTSIYALRFPEKNPLLSRDYSLKTTFTRTGKIDEIFIGKSVASPVMARKVIDDIGKYHPNKVSPSQVAVARRQVHKMSMFQDTSCSARYPEKTVYQMLSNHCTGTVAPEICDVQLICSTSTSSCKISIIMY